MKRKKRKDLRKDCKGEWKRGHAYSLSDVFHKDGKPYMISRNAVIKFFGIGWCDMKTVEKSVKEGNVVHKVHGQS